MPRSPNRRDEPKAIDGMYRINYWTRHFKRVVGYARTSDYVAGGAAAAFAPVALATLERFAPSHAGKGGFPKAMRLAGFIGLAGGFLYFYQRSARTIFPLPRQSPPPSANTLTNGG
jgi:hypothetical protein